MNGFFTIAMFGLLFKLPESPRWLMGQGREREARGDSPSPCPSQLHTPRHPPPLTLIHTLERRSEGGKERITQEQEEAHAPKITPKKSKSMPIQRPWRRCGSRRSAPCLARVPCPYYPYPAVLQPLLGHAGCAGPRMQSARAVCLAWSTNCPCQRPFRAEYWPPCYL